MENQRLILWFVFALIAAFIVMRWEQEHAPPPSAGPAAAQDQSAPGGVPATPDAPASASAGPLTAIETAPTGPRITVVTDRMRVEIDSNGGDLRRLALLSYPVSIERADQPFELLQESAQEFYIVQSGLVGQTPDYPTHKVRYDIDAASYQLVSGRDELRVPLHWRAPDGTRYIKTYVFHRDSYVIDVEFTVINATRNAWSGYLYGQLIRAHTEQGGMFALPTYTGGAIYTPEEQYQKIKFTNMAETPLKREVAGGWVAILQHHFVGAWMRAADERSQFYTEVLLGPRYVIGFKSLTAATVAPGATATLSARLYAGPKEQTRLEQAAPGMDLTVDYGWLTLVAGPLFEVLSWIHRWVGNWGWAIIFLTILIKLAFYPLSAASFKSMAHMKKLQPKMQSIKERFGDDRQKMSEAMMQLYKTEKINPLGGCLPILVQIPVFIALYWVLLESVEMRQTPFILWIKDLSMRDPYFVLPLIMGATMFLQQKMSPTPVDPVQAKVFMVMPVIFTGFFLFFPAGLVLYWVVNNSLSIAQQWNINRTLGEKAK